MNQRHQRQRGSGQGSSGIQRAVAPGKQTRTMGMGTGMGMGMGMGTPQRGGRAGTGPRGAGGSGGGESLPAEVRGKMEVSFGVDFSAVRVHEGPQAEALGAQAFARGSDLFFAPGQYDPHSAAGQELLGHELAHVVQQSQGKVAAPAQAKGGAAVNADAGLEREADEAGARAARGEPALAGGVGSLSSLSSPGAGVAQCKLVVDHIFTANTAKLDGQLRALESLRNVVAVIENHPLNALMAIDVYVEGGQQNERAQMGSTVVKSVDGQDVGKNFQEYPMTEALIRAHSMMIGVKVNLDPEDYQDYEQDQAHHDEDSLGEMIATFLHEVHLHVLPKMDQMVALKQRDPGNRNFLLAAQTVRGMSPAMAQVMGASDIDEHDDPGSWSRLLDSVTHVADELARSQDQSQWALAYAAVNSVVNDVMTHTVPNPQERGMQNLTPNMPLQQKAELFDRADQLAKVMRQLYEAKFPAAFAGESDEEMSEEMSEERD